MTETQRPLARHKHSSAHPWYRSAPNNRRFQQFEEEAGIAARGIQSGLLAMKPQAPRPKPTGRHGGRPGKLGIVVPYDRTTQPSEYHRAYMAEWKRLQKHNQRKETQ